jgi:hypothetical protein
MTAAAAFNATMTDRPLWANADGHPTIWMRWMPWHEAAVVAEQSLTFGPRGRISCIGRLVTMNPGGKWYVGDWRPMCGTCCGAGQVVVTVADDEGTRRAYVEAIASTVNAGLYYMVQASVECPDCLAHPGWVVG